MSSRSLASSSGSDGSDYTVALVAMVVVALILIVDCLREKLDHAVQHRPLSHQVVERCYRELTTLGVVEFLIFLVHEIDPDFPIDLEMKFGRVRSRRRADKTHIFFTIHLVCFCSLAPGSCRFCRFHAASVLLSRAAVPGWRCSAICGLKTRLKFGFSFLSSFF